MKVHCLFEQSGTFKNEFIKLGYEAEDYDILNDYGQTDHQIDLFNEIEKAFCYRESIFDKIKKDDLVMSFFPCTRFEDQIGMGFRGTMNQQQKWDDEKKILYSMKLHKELHDLYEYISMMIVVALRGGFKMIVENPYSTQHYLQRYFPVKPKLIDYDRHERGDYYKKPTQYWFINMKPANTLIFETVELKKLRRIEFTKNDTGNAGNAQKNRSEISSDYANRFIREFIL